MADRCLDHSHASVQRRWRGWGPVAFLQREVNFYRHGKAGTRYGRAVRGMAGPGLAGRCGPRHGKEACLVNNTLIILMLATIMLIAAGVSHVIQATLGLG